MHQIQRRWIGWVTGMALVLSVLGADVRGVVIGEIDLDRSPAEQALLYWAQTVDTSVIINWDRMEAYGYDRSQPVTLRVKDIDAMRALQLIMSEAFPDGRVIAEITPQYVRILAKEHANQRPVTRVYPVGDLLMDTGRRTAPPEFALSQTTSDQDGGGSGSIFEDTGSRDDAPPSRTERVEALMNVIRRSVEPDIWEANGGRSGRISYLDGNLIISAPMYVHHRLGLTESRATEPSARRSAPAQAGTRRATTETRVTTERRSTNSRAALAETYRRGYSVTRRSSDGVSGINWAASPVYGR